MCGTLHGPPQRGDAKRCGLRVFVPERFADLQVRTEGVQHLERRTRQGNVVLRGCVADTFRLTLR